jgi:hypothetical protein
MYGDIHIDIYTSDIYDREREKKENCPFKSKPQWRNKIQRHEKRGRHKKSQQV